MTSSMPAWHRAHPPRHPGRTIPTEKRKALTENYNCDISNP
jgi:hypothetical protein